MVTLLQACHAVRLSWGDWLWLTAVNLPMLWLTVVQFTSVVVIDVCKFTNVVIDFCTICQCCDWLLYTLPVLWLTVVNFPMLWLTVVQFPNVVINRWGRRRARRAKWQRGRGEERSQENSATAGWLAYLQRWCRGEFRAVLTSELMITVLGIWQPRRCLDTQKYSTRKVDPWWWKVAATVTHLRLLIVHAKILRRNLSLVCTLCNSKL